MKIFYCFDAKSGKLLWTWHVPDAGSAGAGRGPATFYDGVLYMSTGPSVFAVDPEDGKLIGQKHIGGAFRYCKSIYWRWHHLPGQFMGLGNRFAGNRSKPRLSPMINSRLDLFY